MALSAFGPTGYASLLGQRPSYMPWTSEDYERELNRLQQLKLDATTQSLVAQQRSDASGLATQQKALQSLATQEAALQARGNREAASAAESNERSWRQFTAPSWTGDAPRQQYMSYLGGAQDANNIRNVLAGKPRQMLNVETSLPGYLIDKEAMAKRKQAQSGGAQAGEGGVEMPGYSSPYSALQNAQLDAMNDAGINPTLAREMNLAKLRQMQGAADTAVGASPFGQETAENAKRGDLMSGRTAIFEKARADLDNQKAQQKAISEAETFFQPEVAGRRMLETDAATQAMRQRYVAPQQVQGDWRAELERVKQAGALSREQIKALTSTVQTALESETRAAVATQLSQAERDRATKKAQELAEMRKALMGMKGYDEQ